MHEIGALHKQFCIYLFVLTAVFHLIAKTKSDQIQRPLWENYCFTDLAHHLHKYLFEGAYYAKRS